jgi:hypothetical protein
VKELMTMRTRLFGLLVCVTLAAVLSAGCGGGSERFDQTGYITGEDQSTIFIRGCQQYFRGSLTSSRETFNSLIYRFPDSPLKNDAQLAVRRIEADLSGQEISETVETHVNGNVIFPAVAIVGSPSVSGAIAQLELLILTTGMPPLTVEDSGAPDVTLVLYPEGYLEQANLVSDSLSRWLASHSSVPVQPGGDIISTVAPQHSGVVVVIGSDAVVDPQVLRNHSIEP